MRAAICPLVNVSTMASVPCRSCELLQDDALERLVVLGEDEVAEALAHFRSTGASFRQISSMSRAAHGELGLELRVVRAEAELHAAVRRERPPRPSSSVSTCDSPIP